VWASRESVGGGIVLTGAVVYGGIGLCKLQLPVGLAAAHGGLGAEVLQGLVVRVHLDMPARDVRSEEAEGVDYGEKFLLVSGVVLLGWRQLVGEQPYRALAGALVLC